MKADQGAAKPKYRYRVTNSAEYDRVSVNRGNLTISFDKVTIKDAWPPPSPVGRGKPGLYSTVAIRTCLMHKTLFRLPYPATEVAHTRAHAAHLLHTVLREIFVPDAAKTES